VDASVTVGDGEEWLVYQWLDGSDEGVFVVRPDGSGQHQLVPDLPGSEIHPDWSPDGTRIAFVRFTPEDRSELWVVDADGGGKRRLATCDAPCNSYGFPDWTTDGSAIFFSQDANAPPGEPPTTFQIARYDVATDRSSVVLTREDGMTVEEPRIAPDGRRVVYVRFRGEQAGEAQSALFVSDLAGGRERRLTPWSMQASYPDWSRDDVILFHTYDLGAFQTTTEAANLYTIAPDGRGLRQLTRFGDGEVRATQPRFAPDGSGIVYTAVEGPGYGTRTAAFLPAADGDGSPFSGDTPIVATHPELRPVG
jgi:TolB protein